LARKDFADFLGRFNTLIATVALCVLCNACLWLPAGDSLPLLVKEIGKEAGQPSPKE
jgi:hypothetical protein